MIIAHLSLTNFRNYSSLELDLPPRMTLLQGDNAQGKSNLLEAIYILATGRSPRASNERELINWAAFQDRFPVCRLVADVHRAAATLRLEIAMRAKHASSGDADAPPPIHALDAAGSSSQKRIRINGVPRRAIDLVGQVNVVLFSVQDINLIGGEPALRRRFLDITNSQVDAHYLRQLQRYQRVVWQRNRLLRQMADSRADWTELSVWDEQLVRTGADLILRRQNTIADLQKLAPAIHAELSGEPHALSLVYIRSIDRERREHYGDSEEIVSAFSRALEGARNKEMAQGVSLVGPHRDELRFLAGEVDVGIFGSRGQQRTVALALKLAEAGFMLDKTGEHPVLLLDDVLSELDSRRRTHLLRHVAAYSQVIVTATDIDHFDSGFLEQAALYRVSGGRVEPQGR